MSRTQPSIDDVHGLLSIHYVNRHQAFNEDLTLLLPKFELFVFSSKEINKLLLIDFKERNVYLPLGDFLLLLLD